MTTYRDEGPTVFWTDIDDAFLAEDAPLTAELLKALRDNNEYLMQVLTNTTGYTSEISHEHRGADDAIPFSTLRHNLIRNPCPNSRADEKGMWPKSGFEAVLPHETGGGLTTQGAGEWAYHPIGGRAALNFFKTMGQGTSMTFSLFAKSIGAAPSQGALTFGPGGGSGSSIATNVRTEVTGGLASQSDLTDRAVIHSTDITTSWQRFWCPFDAIASVGGDLRFSLSTEKAFDQLIYVTGFHAVFGLTLVPFHFGNMEKKEGKGINHRDYGNYPETDVPLYSYDVNITNAIELKSI